MGNPRAEPCVGPGCREQVDPGEYLCVCCRLELELHGHEALVDSLDEAEERGREEQVAELVHQAVHALVAERRRHGR